MTDLASTLRAAQDGFSADEYIRRVKISISDEMRRIDPSVQIEDTSYFNHSAIPDLVIRWTRDADARSVYLRGSYAAIVASRDTEFIKTGRPILLAIDPSMQISEPGDTPVSTEILSATARTATDTLITDSQAMGTLGDPPDETETPLGPLVRANYLQGGRGLIDPDRASLLVQTGSRDNSARTALETAVSENFLPDAATRLQRTAQVIDAALGQVADAEGISPLSIIGGQLTTVELRAILPWLMQQDGLTEDLRFWARLGDLFDLAMLEQVSSELTNADLSRLVRANANKWTARRSYLGLATIDDEADSPASASWKFRGSNLGIDFGNQRISIATSGRALPGRDSIGSPLWEDISSSVNRFSVVAATLRGVTRSISVTAEESADVKGDVAEIVSSVEDSFRLERLTVRVDNQPSGEPTDIEVDFRRSVATASPQATIRDLVRTTGRIAAFREAIAEELIDAAILLISEPD